MSQVFSLFLTMTELKQISNCKNVKIVDYKKRIYCSADCGELWSDSGIFTFYQFNDITRESVELFKIGKLFSLFPNCGYIVIQKDNDISFYTIKNGKLCEAFKCSCWYGGNIVYVANMSSRYILFRNFYDGFIIQDIVSCARVYIKGRKMLKLDGEILAIQTSDTSYAHYYVKDVMNEDYNSPFDECKNIENSPYYLQLGHLMEKFVAPKLIFPLSDECDMKLTEIFKSTTLIKDTITIIKSYTLFEFFV